MRSTKLVNYAEVNASCKVMDVAATHISLNYPVPKIQENQKIATAVVVLHLNLGRFRFRACFGVEPVPASHQVVHVGEEGHLAHKHPPQAINSKKKDNAMTNNTTRHAKKQQHVL